MSAECCGTDQDEDPSGSRLDGPDQESCSPPKAWQVREIQLAGTAGTLLLAGFVARWLGADTAGIVLYLAGAVVGGSTFVPGALGGLLRGRTGVGLLMTIALVGALILGQFAEAAALAFLFSISEALEDYSLSRTRRGLRALLALVPDEVTIVKKGRQHTVSAAEVQPGDLMIIRAGERVASDGVVREGRSSVDTSPITGESIPTEIGPDQHVYAGSINGHGSLTVEATATIADNSLAKVVRITEDAQRQKGHRQRLADRIARPLVPAIMIVAVLIAVGGSVLDDPAPWIERALVVLVAAAPCALAISVPVTVIAAVGAASRLGVL
ncbi:MAG: HAD-IC family P-type ATPase, partial [Microlunatus sp.]|nr:HAD-IC family P-type ATPase [Microlunatus sp.]